MRRVRSLLLRLYGSAVRPLGRLGGDLLGLVPALIAGAGVFLVVAGLFYYLQPADASPGNSSSPSPIPLAVASFPAGLSLAPSTGPTASGNGALNGAVATRIRIRAIVPPIDLPIVHPPANEEFVLCNVAEYMVLDAAKPMSFPGLPRATFLYAHARAGMFLPLLDAERNNTMTSLIGLWVEVYTDDDQDHVYQISEVIPHVNDSSEIDRASAVTSDQLWLQTSEGKVGTTGRMYVVAQPIGVLAASQADAHPTGKGSVCPDAPICKHVGDGACRPA